MHKDKVVYEIHNSYPKNSFYVYQEQVYPENLNCLNSQKENNVELYYSKSSAIQFAKDAGLQVDKEAEIFIGSASTRVFKNMLNAELAKRLPTPLEKKQGSKFTLRPAWIIVNPRNESGQSTIYVDAATGEVSGITSLNIH